MRRYPNDVVSEFLLNNFYVDNFLVTSSAPSELETVYSESSARLTEGGFELRSWNTNLDSLKARIEDDGRGSQHECSEERVLGYLYNINKDTLRLCDFELEENVSTKREILSQISKVFDPLSLCLPVLIRGRLLMRKIWKGGGKWDEPVSSELVAEWKAMKPDFEKLKTLVFSRSVFDGQDDSSSLCVFCDASTTSYGFVVYVRSSVGARFLLSKGKVAPLKGRTLPSLELLAVFLAIKCLPQILESFRVKFKQVVIFSDAQIVLSWILNKNVRFKQLFVRNRIQDIKSKTRDISSKFGVPIEFRYVRSEENPADLLTRGQLYRDFSREIDFWNKGPEWLSLDSSYWPKYELSCLSQEMKENEFATVQAMQTPPPLINAERFSSLGKLLRVTSLIFKFGTKSTVDTFSKARLYWMRTMQRECFSDEIAFLVSVVENPGSDKTVPKLVRDLNLFLDDSGLIRTRGRLSRSNYYNFEILNPVLLGKHHYLTKLFIKDAHESCKHLGIQSTLTHLRLRGLWVVGARHTIRRVLTDCVVCNKFKFFAFQYPKFTNFTRAQMNFVRPYKHVGIDFTKHWYVTNDGSGVTTKMYILIYTCLNIRAVHFDLLPDMSTKSVLQSFKRFTNSYGVCEFLYSDNARSFKQAGDVLEDALIADEFKNFMLFNQIKHVRIPLYSPWMGAAWERLIRVLKKCLYKSMGRGILTYFELERVQPRSLPG